MQFLAMALFILFIFVGIDIYAYSGLKDLFAGHHYFGIVYILISVSTIASFLIASRGLRISKDKVRPPYVNILMGYGFSILVAKFIFSCLLLLLDLARFLHGAIDNLFLGDLISGFPDRSIIALQVIAVFSFIILIALFYGVLFGKYNFKVDEVTLDFDDLPDAFDGFRLAQISDIHSGTYDSIKNVAKGVKKLADQKVDLITFTGDLVNSQKDEIDPFIHLFEAIKAPSGKFSVLGNHDYYGLYRIPISDTKNRDNYWFDLLHKHDQMGFQLLNNASAEIKKGDDSIRIVGVENWGAGPFPKRGNLNRALTNVEKDAFCILLSHDPTHWDEHTKLHDKKIHLTLAGHTHGMQFGIDIFGIKWSPVKYRYKKWIGLYEEFGKYLYVNRGFGFLGWPGRVGMRPEITVFTLRRR